MKCALMLCLAVCACTDANPTLDAGSGLDAANTDAGFSDVPVDASAMLDTSSLDASVPLDGESVDAQDTGLPTDAGPSGNLVVYPALPGGEYRSSQYAVRVEQGARREAIYVYTSPNTFNLPARAYMTDANHFGSFSFDGSVTVEVTMESDVAGASIHPLSAGIVPTISGRTIRFEVSEPGNLFVKVEGSELDPLFVFANPLETEPPPEPEGENVLYFGPGLHDYEGPDLPDGTEVYLDGGAYVRGLLKFEVNAQVRVRGRGVLSGISFPWSPEWTSHLVELSGGRGNLTMEGVVLTDSPKSNIVSYAPCQFDNIKLLGWHRNNDGATIGEGSTVRNSFFKVNDDVLKIYYSNIEVSNVVIWQQPVGAAFQLSWNISREVTAGRIRGVDVIACDRIAGNFEQTQINNALVASRNLNGADIHDLVFEDFRVECDEVFQMVSLHTQSHQTGFQSGTGTVRDIEIRNWTLAGRPRIQSSMWGNGPAGEVRNVTFANVRVASERVAGRNYADGTPFVTLEGAASGTTFE